MSKLPNPISDVFAKGRGKKKSNYDEKRFFGEFAEQWWDTKSIMTPLSSFNPLRFEFFGKQIEDWSGLDVLDVGCGGGYTCEFVDERGANVTGIDANEKLIAVADAHAQQLGRSIDYNVGVAERLPFADQSFDVVTCVDVLEHVDSVGQAVSEIARVLRPGGWFCFDTINRTLLARLNMIWIPERVLGIVPRGAHQFEKFVTPREMLIALGSAGLAPVGQMGGIAIRGSNSDGTLKAKHVRNLNTLYLGVARRPEVNF